MDIKWIICFLYFSLCFASQYLSNFNSTTNQLFLDKSKRQLLESKTYVIYVCKSGGWSSDYFLEFFPPSDFIILEYQEFITKNDPQIIPRVLIYNVENSGDDGKYQVVRDLLAKYRIVILLHTSDEFQGSSRKWKYGEGVEVYDLAPLVLREYAIFPYRNFGLQYYRSNVMQIPLGYMKGMLITRDGLKLTSDQATLQSLEILSKDRNISWSFFGTISNRKGRGEAIQAFKSWEPHLVDSGLSPSEVFEKYRMSKFVLSPRGQAALDCYRIYESIMAGAIPIVIGPEREIELTFEFEGDPPPLMFGNDYESTIAACRNMTDDKIDRQRRHLAHWYLDRLSLIQRRIRMYLKNYPFP